MACESFNAVVVRSELNMGIEFNLELAWSQISLFEANLTDPFNDWNERHLAQGFTWRPGSVSFRTVERHGDIAVTVDFIGQLAVDPEAHRAVVVPFTCWGGVVEISTIAQSELLEIPAGRYALLYQVGVSHGQQWVKFGLLEAPFMPVEAVILRGDSEVDGRVHLLMEAEPAA